MTIQQVPQDQWSPRHYERYIGALEQAGRAPVRDMAGLAACAALA